VRAFAATSVLLATVVAAVPLPLRADGVGDAAARRRPAVTPLHGSVFTNEDLDAARARAAAEKAAEQQANEAAGQTPDPADLAPPQATGSAAPETTPAALKPSGDAHVAAPGTGRVAQARASAERAALEARWRARFEQARLQLAVAEAGSWRESYRTTNYRGVAVRTKVRQQVDTPELREARAALAALEDELRRSGLPAEWAAEP
jgi:hypothetical protein